MAAGKTYTPLATYTTSGSSSSYTFNSISSAYTDLVLVMKIRETTNQQGYVRVNGDSGTNYSRTYLYSTGTAVGSGRIANQTGINVSMGDTYAMNIINFLNYSNTNVYKTILEESGDNNSVVLTSYLWRSKSAISSITIASFDGGNGIASGATFTLYGIAAA